MIRFENVLRFGKSIIHNVTWDLLIFVLISGEQVIHWKHLAGCSAPPEHSEL